jgi:hypothetical protein
MGKNKFLNTHAPELHPEMVVGVNRGDKSDKLVDGSTSE